MAYSDEALALLLCNSQFKTGIGFTLIGFGKAIVII